MNQEIHYPKIVLSLFLQQKIPAKVNISFFQKIETCLMKERPPFFNGSN